MKRMKVSQRNWRGQHFTLKELLGTPYVTEGVDWWGSPSVWCLCRLKQHREPMWQGGVGVRLNSRGAVLTSQKDLGQRKQCQIQFLSCFPWRLKGKLQFSSSGSCSYPLTCLSPQRLFTFPTSFRTATAQRTEGDLQSALSYHLSFILGLPLIIFLSVII